MKGISKFEHLTFYDDFNDNHLFAVSKQKYTEQEACKLFEIETDYCKAEYCKVQDGAVVWRAGVIDNEPHVCWWLERDCDGTEPRHCPVWVIEY